MFLKRPVVVETRAIISWYSLCVYYSENASQNSVCAISEFEISIFELKCMILNCDNS